VNDFKWQINCVKAINNNSRLHVKI